MQLTTREKIVSVIQQHLTPDGFPPLVILRTTQNRGEMIRFEDPSQKTSTQFSDVLAWLEVSLPGRTDIREVYLPMDCSAASGQGTTMPHALIALVIRSDTYDVGVIEYDPTQSPIQSKTVNWENDYWRNDVYVKTLASRIRELLQKQ